jgi:hypothetical protein
MSVSTKTPAQKPECASDMAVKSKPFGFDRLRIEMLRLVARDRIQSGAPAATAISLSEGLSVENRVPSSIDSSQPLNVHVSTNSIQPRPSQ